MSVHITFSPFFDGKKCSPHVKKYEGLDIRNTFFIGVLTLLRVGLQQIKGRKIKLNGTFIVTKTEKRPISRTFQISGFATTNFFIFFKIQ